MRRITIRTLPAVIALSGCASPVVQSRLADPTLIESGLAYALPLARLQLVAQRKMVDAEEVTAAIKAAADATAAVEAATKRLVQAEAALKDAKDSLAATPAEGKEELTKQLAIAQAWFDVLTKRLANAKAAEKKAHEQRDLLSGNVGKWVDSASLAFLPNVPDNSARFIALHNASAARDDALKIGVKDGLLSSSSATTTDQTPAILINLAGAASLPKASASRTLSVVNKEKNVAPDAKATECEPFQASFVFDPTNKDRVNGVKAALLKRSNGTMRLEVAGLSDATPAVVEPKKDYGGYLYRPARAISASVLPTTAKSNCFPSVQTALVQISSVVPDSSSTLVLPVTAAALVKSKVEHTFKDGMPVELSIDKPSELVAFSSLPLDLAKAVISVPASLIKVRVDYDSQATALAEGRLKLLNAQIALKKAQDAMDAAEP